MPENQASRAKSWPPGRAAWAGGRARALAATKSPAAKFSAFARRQSQAERRRAGADSFFSATRSTKRARSPFLRARVHLLDEAGEFANERAFEHRRVHARGARAARELAGEAVSAASGNRRAAFPQPRGAGGAETVASAAASLSEGSSARRDQRSHRRRRRPAATGRSRRSPIPARRRRRSAPTSPARRTPARKSVGGRRRDRLRSVLPLRPCFSPFFARWPHARRGSCATTPTRRAKRQKNVR